MNRTDRGAEDSLPLEAERRIDAVCVRFEEAWRAGEAARLEREARTVSSLDHPHIYTLYDIAKHDGQPFLVMEFVEGQTLRALVGQELDIDALTRLVAQVANALKAAHLAGVVHRDIKPE